jgi:hypothetical protein
MASTTASASPRHEREGGGEVSLLRLYVLRATYLLLIVGLGVTVIPQLFIHEPTSRGVLTGVLSGVWLLAFLGLRYPLQMLPLLLFECVWKTAWLTFYGLPQWLGDAMPPTWPDDFQAIAAGAILMPLVIPWGYVYRRFVRMPKDSVADGVSLIRLRALRIVYVLLTIAGTFVVGRILLNIAPMERGVFASMLIALFLLSFLVIRNPLKMLPLLLLEFVWKTIWLMAFGLPQWISGTGSPRLAEDLIGVGAGPIFFGLLIPWGYVWRHYIKAPADRWR